MCIVHYALYIAYRPKIANRLFFEKIVRIKKEYVIRTSSGFFENRLKRISKRVTGWRRLHSHNPLVFKGL